MSRYKNEKFNRNPEGHGGFKENPQNRSNGRWDKTNSISYWMQYYLQLTVAEFRNYEKNKPEERRTMSESIAYARVHNARRSLKDAIEVTNRTSGYPRQSSELIVEDDSLYFHNLSDEELYEIYRGLDRKIKKIIKKKA